MKTWFLIVAVALGCLLSGCMFKHVSEQDLLGKYQADLPDGTVEILELLPKGVCVQEIRLKDGASYKAEGDWKYDVERGRIFLRGIRQALTPPGVPNPDIAQPPDEVPLATPVSRTLMGAVTIMMHVGIDYQKQ